LSDEAKAGAGGAGVALAGAKRAGLLLAPAIFLAMFGYGAYAEAMGLDLWLAVAACVVLWGIPQQLTYTDLAHAGTTMPVMALSVALVSGRSFFLNVACAPLIRDPRRPFPARLWLFAQFISPSNWAHMRLARDRLHPDRVHAYFAGVAAVALAASLARLAGG
jgi:predicted branched-subunit amino acid permease